MTPEIAENVADLLLKSKRSGKPITRSFLPKIYKKTGENVFVSQFIRIFVPRF